MQEWPQNWKLFLGNTGVADLLKVYHWWLLCTCFQLAKPNAEGNLCHVVVWDPECSVSDEKHFSVIDQLLTFHLRQGIFRQKKEKKKTSENFYILNKLILVLWGSKGQKTNKSDIAPPVIGNFQTRHNEESKVEVSGTAQWVRVPEVKTLLPLNPSSIPRTHVGKGENQFLQVVLWSPLTCLGTLVHLHTHTHCTSNVIKM